MSRASTNVGAGLRVVQVGMSTSPVCGVRDCASVLESALVSRGVTAPLLWCEITGDRLRPDRMAVREWRAQLRSDVRPKNVDAVLLHYSVFAFGWRGLPIFAPSIARELRGLRIPVLALLHELAYPFGRRGLRGTVQAVSQRLVLRAVVESCDAAIVTTERRKDWLLSSKWFSTNLLSFVPVPSNLPTVTSRGAQTYDGLVVAVVGYAAEEACPEVVSDAVARLRRDGRTMTLLLIGAPGSEGLAAERWRREFDLRGIADVLTFTGVQPPSRLARVLSEADLVVLPDYNGPDSRRGMLAAALGAGQTVLALDGPGTWRALDSEQALVLVPHDATVLAGEIARYASDPGLRAQQGAAARRFYLRWSSPEAAAEKVSDLLGAVAGSSPVNGASAL